MKKQYGTLLIAVIFCLATVTAVFAQGEEMTLKLTRLFGYGGFNGDIQGNFSIEASGPSNLARVEFFLDTTKMGEVTAAPYKLQFVTDNYPTGAHVLSAVGYTADGKTINSNKINALFVSASEGGSATMQMVIPILAVVFGAILLSAVVSIFTGRKAKNLPAGTARNYTFGGGICPKCQRPIAFSMVSLKLILGKIDRCPHCGRYGFVRTESLDTLRAAERAELEGEKGHVPSASAEDKLKKELDDSKYQDM
jgi:hypothetical protein